MPYESIPGVRATYLDGAFRIPTATSQPLILVVGPTSSGLTNEFYNVTNVARAEAEFGADTEVLKFVHEAVAQGADNLAIVRSGGTQGSWVFTDSDSATLTITPEYRDDDILGRYALFIENDGTSNRYMVYDLTDETWVYDSDEILVLDEGIVTVADTGIDLFTLYDKDDIPAAEALDQVVTANFAAMIAASELSADGTATASTGVATEGTDGQTVSRVERYAALNTTYHYLDYRDCDMVIPTDVYIDDKSIGADEATAAAAGTGSTDGEKYGYFWKGVPSAGTEIDALGYVWEYRYKGKLYTYFTDCTDAFSASGSDAAATATENTDLVFTARKDGKGGNAITYEVVDTGAVTAGSETAVVTETDYGFGIVIDVEVGFSTNAQAATAASTALAAYTLSTGVLASTLLDVSGGATVIALVIGEANLAGGSGAAWLTHEDLTGDTIPADVTTKQAAGTDSQIREVNFGHQLASFCQVASTTWSQIIGAISFKAPSSGYGRAEIASWVGELPTFTDDGTDVYIDAPADNGDAILGHKLIVGESKTSAGYRNAKVTNGNSTDGYAYGGFILTSGDALPNGDDWPYGINDADEAEDSGGFPIDIGKHLFVSYDWPILTNGFNGGTSYRGSLPASFFGKVAPMDENEEPIGINGQVVKLQAPTRVHSTQVNDLAQARIIGIRRDTSGALIFTTAKNVAHPDSDYTRLSTIRSVNRVLSGIRNLARPYIGKAFNSQNLASLQAAIDGYLQAERTAGIHQGATSRIEYTREDRIMGRLTIKLRMVPPFSIEAIDVETSLAADESEL